MLQNGKLMRTFRFETFVAFLHYTQRWVILKFPSPHLDERKCSSLHLVMRALKFKLQ
jgi:hypothetical protein